MTLESFFRSVYAPVRLLGRSPRTRKLYCNSIEKFSRYLQRPAMVEDLTTDQIAAHLSFLAESGLAMASVAKERAQLLALANFAARRGVCQFPEVPVVRCPERIPEAWTIIELKKLMEACRDQPGFIGGVMAGMWWISLHHALWDTGERIGAILRARWIQLNDGQLYVPAEHRKGSTRDKLYSLSEMTMNLLAKIRNPKRDEIWEWPHSESKLYRDYNQILEQAGLPINRRSKFHRMRRSVASHMKAAGVDPQQQLDHANARTTQSYLDPRIVISAAPKDVLPMI